MREADLYEDVMKKPQGVATAASELSGGPLQKVVDFGSPRNMWKYPCSFVWKGVHLNAMV